ncbi:MAG: magnesium/cobalt transporter CorA [Anaerolineae bacterium]|jgi:magnesium transporter|nr:magnesium/cobalt transporter CorA [Anaerolineae bacterium]
MVRVLHSNGNGLPVESHGIGHIPAMVADPSAVVWVDIYDPEDENGAHPEALHILQDVFGFHPLAVEDALVETHVPKVDDWGSYLYIVMHAVHFEHGKDYLETRELDIFVGSNYLVTYRTQEIRALEQQWRITQRDERHTRRGVDYLLYELCDAIATDYLPVMDTIDEAVDLVQDEVFERRDARLVERIFKLKRAVLDLRRVLSPQREVLNKLSRGDFAVIDERDRVYFRDVYDHFVRLVDLNESLRDVVGGVLDTYLSVAANRTNDIMKTLTIVSLMFLPLTFVTGFFGMNFFGGSIELIFDAPKWPLFFAGMLIMIGMPLAMLMYIRRRGWW